MTTVLALETSTPWLCVGLLNQELGLALEQSVRVERAHAEEILAAIKNILSTAKEQQPSFNNTATLMAVGNGPGSYTGLRVAASTALGLARAWGGQVYGVPTLESIACTHDGIVAVSLDARNNNVYSAMYRVQHGQILETLLKVEKRKQQDFIAQIQKANHHLHDHAPSALGLATLALARFKSNLLSDQSEDIGQLELSYL